MPITAERISRLRSFGLSEYAARAYLALLALGTTEARDVSALSKVPASKIYHILEQLHEKGLVVILPEFPRKYAPVPFSDHLQRVLDEHHAAAEEIERDRDVLAQMFAVVGDVASGDRGSVTLLRGRRNALDRFAEILGNASRDVLLILPPGIAAHPRAIAEPVSRAIARGANVRIMTPALVAGGLRAAIPSATVRTADAAPAQSGLVALVDSSRLLLIHFLPDDGHATEGNDTALHADQDGIVALLAPFLEAPWREGSPLAGRAVPVDPIPPAVRP